MRFDKRRSSEDWKSLVDIERNRRIDNGFTFNGNDFQTRANDRENIAGASTLAVIAIMNGAQANDLRWHGGIEDFSWIATDNSLILMDAFTVIAFGAAVANYKERLYKAARLIKDMEPVPKNYSDDSYWP